MTMVNRAIKQVALIPIHESVTAPGAAYLLLQWVVQCYGMPQKVIADRNPCFMSTFGSNSSRG